MPADILPLMLNSVMWLALANGMLADITQGPDFSSWSLLPLLVPWEHAQASLLEDQRHVQQSTAAPAEASLDQSRASQHPGLWVKSIQDQWIHPAAGPGHVSSGVIVEYCYCLLCSINMAIAIRAIQSLRVILPLKCWHYVTFGMSALCTVASCTSSTALNKHKF